MFSCNHGPGLQGRHAEFSSTFKILTVLSLAGFGLATSANQDGFQCTATEKTDVRKLTLRMPNVHIPAEKTEYLCKVMEIPSDQEYHLVAAETILDNKPRVHHVIVTSCQDNVPLSDEPFVCKGGNGVVGCTKLFHFWSHGLPYGECFHPLAGFKFGKGGITKLNVEVHYENPGLLDDLHDSSGVVLHFTAKLRPFNMAMLKLGQIGVNLPPGDPDATCNATCTARCTKEILTAPIYVTSVHAHMHGLGFRLNFSMSTQGGEMTLLRTYITPPEDSNRTYHIEYRPPFLMRGGDALLTTCEFDTSNKTTVTRWGWGGNDEHCYSTAYFFPAENLVPGRGCTQHGTQDDCDNDSRCNGPDLLNAASPVMKPIVQGVLSACPAGCDAWCQEVVAVARRGHHCLRDQWFFMKTLYTKSKDAKLLAFMAAVDACSV